MDLKNHIIRKLKGYNECSIATFDGVYIDNTIVSYYSKGLNIYFGAFSDTLKCRNIKVKSLVALTMGNIQIHAIATKIDNNSLEYISNVDGYLNKFPYYREFFKYNENNLYEVQPLVFWVYNHKKGMMHRDELIIDYEYYENLKPYKFCNQYNERTE